MDADAKRVIEIAAMNDKFRSGFSFMLTRGVQALPDIPGLIQAVRSFSDFSEDNDPYGEHDFGSLVWFDEKVFWKIDYYDQNLEFGLDPLDKNCKRVLTILLAEEY